MQTHDVRVHPSKSKLVREDQLAWRIAAVAADLVRGAESGYVRQRLYPEQ